MLNYNEITQRKYINLDGQIFEVISSNISKKQQRRPVNQTKLKNSRTGKVTERTFHQSEKVEEAELEKFNIIYLYSRNGESFFHSEGDPSDRFSIPEDFLGKKTKFLPQKTPVEIFLQEGSSDIKERVIEIKIPIKIKLKVVTAPPAVRGNTAQGGEKLVELETGASVNTPLFIKEGDEIIINTETGEYVERA